MRDTPSGYAVIIDPDAPRMVELNTETCIHCGMVMHTNGLRGTPEILVFREDGSHYTLEATRCNSCWQWTCPKCRGKPCNNRFRRLDEEEKAARKVII